MQNGLQLAKFRFLERTGDVAGVSDPVRDVVAALDSLGLDPDRLRGKEVAVAAGSRGIANIREIVRAACQWLISRGARPFVFPAMGSHGGATDEGQRQVLEEYGIVQEFVGAEIRSSMQAVPLGQTPEGFPVYVDQNAWKSDGVLIINRVKPHTRFSGKIESGLVKMIAIGMGKRKGAEECHQLFLRHGFEPVARSIAATVLGSGKVIAGLAIVENSRHQTAAIRAAAPEHLVGLDEEMLVLAKSFFPKIPFPYLHLLAVDEIGKDVSGTGMDAKVIGRGAETTASDDPKIEFIYVRDLTHETRGNGLGVGLADLIHERVYRKIDLDKTYVNARTSLNPWVARLPMWFRSDCDALDFVLHACGNPSPAEQRVVSIRNTLTFDRILVSEALAGEESELSGWQVSSKAQALRFDNDGNLPFPD